MSAEAYRVSPGIRVRLGGKNYRDGQDVPLKAVEHDHLIATWLRAGWIEPKPARGRSATA